MHLPFLKPFLRESKAPSWHVKSALCIGLGGTIGASAGYWATDSVIAVAGLTGLGALAGIYVFSYLVDRR